MILLKPTSGTEFIAGITEAEENSSKANNRIVVLFVAIGIGIVVFIAVVSMITYFGFRKCNSNGKQSMDSKTENEASMSTP